MSFEFAPPSLVQPAELPWSLIASAWRGAVLELYSRAEQSVDDCIQALENAGHELGADSHHLGALARSRALKAYLETSEFTPHSKVCSERLGDWQLTLSRRSALAHGVMDCTDRGIALRYEEHKGSNKVTRHERVYSVIEMTGFLRSLEADYTQLHMQLGQIKAAARRG